MIRRQGNVLLIVVLLSISAFTQSDSRRAPDFTIVTKHEYRGTEIVSVTQLERMYLANPLVEKEPMSLGSFFVFDEKTGVVGGAIISFYSRSKECLFNDKPTVIFLVDGETMSISGELGGTARGEGFAWSFPDLEEGMCVDAIDVSLPKAKYLKIASAKKSVKIKTGKLNFELTRLHKAALNEMSRRMPK